MINLAERNLKSILEGSDFEKAIFKACFSEDENKVKDKHIATILEYIAGSRSLTKVNQQTNLGPNMNSGVQESDSAEQAILLFNKKIIEFQNNFTWNAKQLYVLHRALDS